MDLKTPYLASSAFSDREPWAALGAAELQDVSLYFWAEGPTHSARLLSPAQAEPQAWVIAMGIFWCGTHLHSNVDFLGDTSLGEGLLHILQVSRGTTSDGRVQPSAFPWRVYGQSRAGLAWQSGEAGPQGIICAHPPTSWAQ